MLKSPLMEDSLLQIANIKLTIALPRAIALALLNPEP
jgi:hypothetical protein